MFTGIIEAVGTIRRCEPRGGDLRLGIDAGTLDLSEVGVGDSIAVNGVCLTAVEVGNRGFSADVSGETLAITTVGSWRVGDPVNLEPALTLSKPLGGHLVSGHVDGVGEVLDRRADGRSERFVFRAPEKLARYIAHKGSICVDGVSLTVNGVDGRDFDVNIVPHTQQATTLGDFRPGRHVNLEVDIVARYMERLMVGRESGQGSGITLELLARQGFTEKG